MSSIDDQKGANAPHRSDAPAVAGSTPEISYPQKVDDSYGSSDDGYPYEDTGTTAATAVATTLPAVQPKPGGGGGGGKPPDPPSGGDGGDDDEEGMLRMSFLEHLE